MQNSVLMAHPIMRWAPHVNDAVLLAAAAWLAILLDQYPWTADWLFAKFLGLVIYVMLGAQALRGSSARRRIRAFVLALGVFAWVASVAVLKHPLGIFIRLVG